MPDPVLPADAFPQPDQISRTVLTALDTVASLGMSGFGPALVQDVSHAHWYQFLLVPVLTMALVGLVLPAKAMMSGFAVFIVGTMVSFHTMIGWEFPWLLALPLSFVCGAVVGFAGVLVVRVALRLLRSFTASIGYERGTLLRAVSTFAEFVLFASIPTLSTIAVLGGLSELFGIQRLRHVELLTGLGTAWMLYLGYRHRMVDITARAQLGHRGLRLRPRRGGDDNFLDIIEDAINPFQS